MSGANKKILLVEDEVTLANLLVDRLNSEGFITFHELNGKAGLERALEEKPDLILLDLMMPVMDGITMLQKLRENSWGKDASVIIMTNLTDDVKLEEAFNNGVYEYLVKSSWHLDDVVEKVKSSLGSA